MQQADRYSLYFGDLHFHTHYSDNRDRASIEAMLLEGAAYNLSIFGTADHHHNLDAEKWRQTVAETRVLREKYTEFLLLNNCEITFLMGHFNVLPPQWIEGTIAEGYRFLYQDKHALKIINHPFPHTDEWHQRIMPDAIGIEVINGSVFAHALKQGYRIASALEIPSVQTYAAYLSLGLPVAAIGGSDAHRKAELGYGMTGFWLSGKPDSDLVFAAISARRTFASTRSDIILDAAFDEAAHEISWTIRWKEAVHSQKNWTVEVYCDDQKIATAAAEGTLPVEKNGFYWIAAFDAVDIAISSPLNVKIPFSGERRSLHNEHILRKAIYYIHQDMTWLTLKPEHLTSPKITAEIEQSLEIQLLSGTETPRILDAHGSDVLYQVIKKQAPRVIIDKTCAAPDFEEFYLWLARNEIHEYVFVNIQYQKVNQEFRFRGDLLPKKMMRRSGWETVYQGDREKLRKIIDQNTRLKLYVSTLPTLVVKIHLNKTPFPLSVFDDAAGLTSLCYYDDHDNIRCPEHILAQVPYINLEGQRPLNENIYQVFI